MLTPPSEAGDAAFRYFVHPAAPEPKGSVVLNQSATLVMSTASGNKHAFAITSQGANDPKPVTTILSASSAEELRRWIRSLNEAIKASGGVVQREATTAAVAAAAAKDRMPKQAASLEQLKALDEPELKQLRLKRLRAYLDYLQIDYSDVRDPAKDQFTSLEEDTERYKCELVSRVMNLRELHKIKPQGGLGARDFV